MDGGVNIGLKSAEISNSISRIYIALRGLRLKLIARSTRTRRLLQLNLLINFPSISMQLEREAPTPPPPERTRTPESNNFSNCNVADKSIVVLARDTIVFDNCIRDYNTALARANCCTSIWESFTCRSNNSSRWYSLEGKPFFSTCINSYLLMLVFYLPSRIEVLNLLCSLT